MNLASHLLRLSDNPALGHVELARIRCELAREQEEAGNYEAAREAMGELWQRIGERPRLDHLDEQTAAEVLWRAGTLSGWIGSARQVEGAQEIAKDLISESAARFEAGGEREKAAEANIDLAICYWREGAFDEARVTLSAALSCLSDKDVEQRARLFLNSAVVERSAKRFNDALLILSEAAPVFEASRSHAIKGKFHHQLATVLKNLGTAENREDYIDRALVEYSAASFHFEQAGHTRFRAAVENNLGFLFLTIGKFAEAQEHLDHSRRLFAGLKDSVHTAQVDETRARAFLAQGSNSRAEEIARSAVRTLERGDEPSLLSEALTTMGTALARMGRFETARAALQRATEAAHRAGDVESAGIAALCMIEELSDGLSARERIEIYERADDLLAGSQQPAILARLRRAARGILAARQAPTEISTQSKFIYGSEEMAELLQRAHRVALTKYVLLISGETGTGKELLARMIHEWSGRGGQFVAVNCAALTEMLIESRLFGQLKSNVKDSAENVPGAVREASGGTLFLDEIAELSIENQGKILRLVESGEIHPVGASKPERVDVRIIAATNRNLGEMVARGQFRDALFYRLSTFHMEIPPLRARRADIPVIAEAFIAEAAGRYGERVHWTPEAITAMSQLPLEGNVRELRALVERTMMLAQDGDIIGPEAVETVALRGSEVVVSLVNPWENFSLKEEVRRIERRFIELALKEAGGRVSQAARLLGFKHHQSLNSLLESKHSNLHGERIPARTRKRSIIRR
jgi:DNA-binding NtrC family response regulator